MMKKAMIPIVALLLGGSAASAQTVVCDTVMGEAMVQPQPTDDHYRVVTNRFWDNWFVFGEVGYHAFLGDYGSVGDFGGLLSPDFKVGVGKWFTPGIGAKVQFGMGNSKGYSKEHTMFAEGGQLTASDGTPYWETKMKWLDFNVNAMFNLSRLFCGYEGKDSKRLMNQFIASVGLGALHHYGIAAQRNEWSGHFELQYSRFFSKRKDLSLDVKAHAMVYQTNFDAVTLKSNGEDSRWFDSNVGLSVGLTYYFKKRYWERCLECEQPIYITNTVLPPDCPEYGTMEFYVFFPNNYSGRDDAPIVSTAKVNAMVIRQSSARACSRRSDSPTTRPWPTRWPRAGGCQGCRPRTCLPPTTTRQPQPPARRATRWAGSPCRSPWTPGACRPSRTRPATTTPPSTRATARGTTA